MVGKGSPPGQTMRHWRPSEDALLLSLAPAKGSGVLPRWPTIADAFNSRTVEPHRPAKALRNRFLRLHKGEEVRRTGGAKNVCKVCFKFKLGHVCPGPPAAPRVVATESDNEDVAPAAPPLGVVEVWADAAAVES